MDGDSQKKVEEKILESLFSEEPRRDSTLQIRQFGQPEPGQIRYFVYADVLQELIKAAQYRSETAVAVLTGQFCMGSKGPFMEVTGFCDLEYLYGDDLVELAGSTVRDAVKQRSRSARESPSNGVVGVFVARPGGKAVLDEETARLHLSFFNLPYQAALVVDGIHQLVGLYGRGREAPFFNGAFFVVDRAKQGDRAPEDDGQHAPDADPPRAEMDTINEASTEWNDAEHDMERMNEND